ncbi:hypothetical protein N7466_007230 [Penicillium verhagenii]|uniref:uncharacterized protein n=1 Tax=Penicillium verhagenii TaxID=1562060 RepID=UPI002544E06D|nr:uncharacterized protein N7466_007230 [Penicillium verhagenii]KAJ5928274.1 hypothetical protein N7466_007230 [Penicillium verhagenii]
MRSSFLILTFLGALALGAPVPTVEETNSASTVNVADGFKLKVRRGIEEPANIEIADGFKNSRRGEDEAAEVDVADGFKKSRRGEDETASVDVADGFKKSRRGEDAQPASVDVADGF